MCGTYAVTYTFGRTSRGGVEVEIGPSTLEERKRVLEVVPRVCEDQNHSVCVQTNARAAPAQHDVRETGSLLERCVGGDCATDFLVFWVGVEM